MKCIFCNKSMSLIARFDWRAPNKTFYACADKFPSKKILFRCKGKYFTSENKLKYSFIEELESSCYRITSIGEFYNSYLKEHNNYTYFELLDNSLITVNSKVLNYFQPLEKSPKEIIKSILTLQNFL